MRGSVAPILSIRFGHVWKNSSVSPSHHILSAREYQSLDITNIVKIKRLIYYMILCDIYVSKVRYKDTNQAMF